MNNLFLLAPPKQRFAHGQAARYFKRALALHEDSASYHADLGAAWFAQNKVDRAIAEYTRAVEFDPDVFRKQGMAGISAQIASPEEGQVSIHVGENLCPTG
jgi:tetratricopeptide (TPR) repeat protein